MLRLWLCGFCALSFLDSQRLCLPVNRCIALLPAGAMGALRGAGVGLWDLGTRPIKGIALTTAALERMAVNTASASARKSWSRKQAPEQEQEDEPGASV